MKHLKIIEVKENKKEYLDLLLLADEQEDMIDRYLSKGMPETVLLKLKISQWLRRFTGKDMEKR